MKGGGNGKTMEEMLPVSISLVLQGLNSSLLDKGDEWMAGCSRGGFHGRTMLRICPDSVILIPSPSGKKEGEGIKRLKVLNCDFREV